MSRMIPPTPVAAPSYGSTAEGWLWLSILNASAHPSPTSTTPAFSPGPCKTRSPSFGKRPRSGREFFYPQCSLHITENSESSRKFGALPISSRMRSYSKSESPKELYVSWMVRRPLPPARNAVSSDPRPSRGQDRRPSRHEADDVAALVADACDVVHRPIGVLQVAQHDATFVFELRDRRGVGEVVPLVVGDGQGQLFPGITARGPQRVYRFDADPYAVADEAHVRVAEQCAWQEVRLSKDLETVTDAKNRASIPGKLLQRPHDFREAGDGARPEIVAIREAAGNDHRVDTLEVGIGMPQLDRFSAHPFHTVKRVPVAIRPWEDRNPDSH